MTLVPTATLASATAVKLGYDVSGTTHVACSNSDMVNPLKGGTLSGTYSIPNFTGCGLTTPLINLMVPGGGNTVSLTLSNGHLVS